MQDELALSRARLLCATRANASYSKQLADLEGSWSGVHASFQGSAHVLERRLEALAECVNAKHEHTAHLAAADTVYQRLRGDINSAQIQHETTYERLNATEEELSKKQNQANAIEHKLIMTAEDHQVLQLKIDEDEIMLDSLIKECSEEQSRLLTTQTQLCSALRSLREAECLENSHCYQYNSSAQRLCVDNRNLAKLKNAFDVQENEIMKIDKCSLTLRERIQLMQRKISSVESERKRHEEKMSQLTCLYDRCATEKRLLESKLEQLSESARAHTNKYARMLEGKEVNPITEQLKEFRAQLCALVHERRELDEQVSRLNQQLTKHQDRLQGVRQDVGAKDRELRAHLDRLSRALLTATVAQASLAQTAGRDSAAQANIRALDAKMTQDESERAAAEQEKCMLQTLCVRNVQAAEDELAGQRKRVVVHKDKLEQTQCCVWACQNTIEELKEKLHKLTYAKDEVNKLNDGKMNDMRAQISKYKVI